MPASRNVRTAAVVLASSLLAVTMHESAAAHMKTDNTDEHMILSQPQRNRKLIINGKTAPEGRYPYFTTLDHYCGGALIAPDTVLTAGHCMPASKHSVKPHVGRYSFLEDDSGQVLEIVAMVQHPKWRAVGDDEMWHDFSLLFLSDVAHDTPYIRLNRDPSAPFPGQEMTAMGVGWTSPDWEHPKMAMVLQEVHLNYLPNDQCELASRSKTKGADPVKDDDDDTVLSFKGRIHPDHLCTTGGPKNKRDACAYDSGSPIIVEGDGPEDDVLHALVSWGEGCADPDFPAVNARVSDAIRFIEASVCKHSKYPPPEFNCFKNSTSEPGPFPTSAPIETLSPSEKTLPPNNMTSLSTQQQWFLLACFFLCSVYCIRKSATPQSDRKDNKSACTPRNKETEYLLLSSPASSKGSDTSVTSGSYDAIEILGVENNNFSPLTNHSRFITV